MTYEHPPFKGFRRFFRKCGTIPSPTDRRIGLPHVPIYIGRDSRNNRIYRCRNCHVAMV